MSRVFTWLCLLALVVAVSAMRISPVATARDGTGVAAKSSQTDAAPVSFAQLAQQALASKRDEIEKAAELELERELALIKKHADDLAYQRTGKRPSEASAKAADAATQTSLMQVQLRSGAELGERQITTDTGDVLKVHYGHGVFNRLKLNQAKGVPTAIPTTNTPAATQSAPSVSLAEVKPAGFRFRSWSLPAHKGPSPDLAGFHAAPGFSSFVDAQATVTATAEEQTRLEQEVNRLETTMLIETGAETTAQADAVLAERQKQESHHDADMALEHENEEAFFGVENESPVASVHQEIEQDVHALVESEADSEETAEGEDSLNSNAAAEPLTSSVEAQLKSSRHALPQKISSNPSKSPSHNANAVTNAASGVTTQTSTPNPAAFLEVSAQSKTPTIPENPGWPFAEPEARETLYQAPNVEGLPTQGYGNLNEYDSHPYDTLLHQAPPYSDRLRWGGAPAGGPAALAAAASSPAPIASGPTAFERPVPYFPSQNPPPLAPMDKPASMSSMLLQGTINQYLRPAMRPISNQHELLANPPPAYSASEITNSVRPTLGVGMNDQVGASTTAAGLDGVQAPADDPTLQFIAGSASGSPIGPHGDQVPLAQQVANGMRLMEVNGQQSQTTQATTTSPGARYGFPAPVGAIGYPLDTRALATSEFLQLPRQVPSFYGDLQIPGGSWAPTGHVDPSLMPPEYVSDTPYFPSQSVGPAYPPAAIETPVNAGGQRPVPGYLGPGSMASVGLGGRAGALAGRVVGGQLPFAPYPA